MTETRPVPPGGTEIPAQQRPPREAPQYAGHQQDAALEVRDKERGTRETRRRHLGDVRGVRVPIGPRSEGRSLSASPELARNAEEFISLKQAYSLCRPLRLERELRGARQ